MDPNKNLAEQLELAQKIQDAYNQQVLLDEEIALALAERVLALDEWLHKDGFLPERWDRSSCCRG